MVGEKRKKRACAVDGRARAARRTSCLSRCPESHAYVVVKESSGLIFINIIESGEGVVVRDAGHLPARKSPLGHGAAADDAARCVKGLTTMRSASTKWSTACPAVRFSISIMNLVAHRPATDEANETLAACGAHGRQGGVAPSASRAELREVSR